jgi:hypothetical protein
MKKLALVIGALVFPLVSFAQDTNLTSFTSLSTGLASIVKTLIPVAFGLAVLFFFWGLATYIIGKDQDKEVAKKRMIWGVIAIFIMSSIWGIVGFISGTLGVGNSTQPGASVKLPSVTSQ